MGNHKNFKIKTIKDWEGEDWDVYEERKTSCGVILYRGWKYGTESLFGAGSICYILTSEIAELIKHHNRLDAAKLLGISVYLAGKFRRLLEIQNQVFTRDDVWLIEHQDEILYDSLNTLKEKYGLTGNQVYKRRKWLAELIEIPKGRRKLRKIPADDLLEKNFQKHKDAVLNMNIEEIMATFNVRKYVAIKYYNRARKELGELSYSEQIEKDKNEKNNWMHQHREELLDLSLTTEELADKFKMPIHQIYKIQKKLKEFYNIPTYHQNKTQWLLDHKAELLELKFSNQELGLKLGLRPEQIASKRIQLKKLLNLPQRIESLHAWREEHQDTILSLDLSIPEIAKMLDRSEEYIERTRMEMRKNLNISVLDQKREWVKQHQHDLQTLTIAQMREKYQLGRYTVQTYRKLLFELKQNENE
ncbi:hypothetical protein [Acinetobacter stercoris]|uniref:Uncharacterized protein n=1 Tax=Acinetobacter stercoris TaxID=2126983 RepID=A0A2U3N3Z4_9GAMM|nr:hypothetical protein [Acinetobacter stercoris]SPL72325.1 hypothetical protein KPC_3503 [Acinetobacter stercoris]